MSLSSFDCSSNFLLCQEDGVDVNSDGREYVTDLDFPVDDEESIAEFIDVEGVFVPDIEYPARFRCRSLDPSKRADAIAWILKVHAYYGFRPLTAYLSVNYLDRFLSSHRLPQANGWPLQLLSVACLSLAAKMEETIVPSLLDLQVGGAKFFFEARTIQRMELLVLTNLKWRMRSVTPFSFIDFFAYKLGSGGTISRFLILRATQIILATIHVIDFLDYWPSSVAAAAILCAAEGIPNLSVVNPGNAASWCDGLDRVREICFYCYGCQIKELCKGKYDNPETFLQERILSCYRLMQETVVDSRRRKKIPKIVPQFRVTAKPVSSSSQSSSSSNKRRKLNNCFWVDGDQER